MGKTTLYKMHHNLTRGNVVLLYVVSLLWFQLLLSYKHIQLTLYLKMGRKIILTTAPIIRKYKIESVHSYNEAGLYL